ncbi:unnamed protein product [Allacma fusca]|uniref:Transcription initiation factor TFIID subunit 6 n=1 Tax=Allacma fusca TaxID=39272 RepID=A0A8J2PGU5_9HEXA|nr:unnamed protein product [Allacma fusca]
MHPTPVITADPDAFARVSTHLAHLYESRLLKTIERLVERTETRMADKEGESTGPVINTVGCTNIYVDSIKAMAESVGISSLQDDAAKEIAEDVTFRLKVIIQDAVKFMELGKRRKLCTQDLDYSLKIKNIEPLYGIQSSDSMSFRFISGGGRELHFVEEKEQDIQDVVSAPVSKVPVGATLRAHWLAIEGQQPSVPENPPPQSKDQQRIDSIDSSNKLNKGIRAKGAGPFAPIVGKPIKFVSSEQVFIKQLATHELSVEQQLYYMEITEACVGSDETKRTEALQSLSNDPGLYEMLPKLCTFISESVRVNVVQYNLALLIYLMRMVKGLLENQTLYLEKYLHEIIPSVATCIVSKQLCLRPEADNHWALRDFASRLMAQICRNYTTSINNIQARMTRIFSQALTQDKMFLSSVYGAIAGLGELGPDVIKAFIIPKIKDIGTRLEFCIDGIGHTQADKTSASKIKALIIKLVAPVLKSKSGSDILEEFNAEYGYLGQALHVAVTQLRVQEQKLLTATTSAGSSTANRPANSPLSSPSITSAPQRVMQAARPISSPQTQSAIGGQKYVIISNTAPQAQSVRMVSGPLSTSAAVQQQGQLSQMAKVLLVNSQKKSGHHQ